MNIKDSNKLREFGNKLLKMRENAKITQSELAEALGDGCSDKLISRYENGTEQMGALRYDKLLSYYGLKVDNPQTVKLLQVYNTLTPEARDQLIRIASVL